MSTLVPSSEDVSYIRAEFVDLEALCKVKGLDVALVRKEFDDGRRPRPTYVLEGGAEFVPADYFEQETERDRFIARLKTQFEQAAIPYSDAEATEVWTDYLSGAFGMCLRNVSPESIVEKLRHMSRISELIETPRPDDSSWVSELSRHVDALDKLERPFCEFDRQSVGRPVSRDTYITAVRQKFRL